MTDKAAGPDVVPQTEVHTQWFGDSDGTFAPVNIRMAGPDAQPTPTTAPMDEVTQEEIDEMHYDSIACPPATADTPTPRTDAQQRASEEAFDVAGLVPAPFARQLERELAAATAKLEACRETAEKDGELFAELIEKKRSAEHASTQWKQAWSESEDRVIAERKAREEAERQAKYWMQRTDVKHDQCVQREATLQQEVERLRVDAKRKARNADPYLKDTFIKLGYWPNEVLWKVWTQAIDAALAKQEQPK